MLTDPCSYAPSRTLLAKLKRRMTQWRVSKPIRANAMPAIISFTFDDFPQSAAQYGAEALDEISAQATYYTCTGLQGRDTVMGQMYVDEDVATLHSMGHEIGLHTHSHLDCARVTSSTILNELDENAARLNSWLGSDISPHFAWPYGETHYAGKTAVSAQLLSARGILPGINTVGSDLMQLRACELTPNIATYKRAKQAIETVAQRGGWLIFFTHDVRKNPSAFGVQPDTLKCLTRQANHSGAEILTVGAAYKRLLEGQSHAEI